MAFSPPGRLTRSFWLARLYAGTQQVTQPFQLRHAEAETSLTASSSGPDPRRATAMNLCTILARRLRRAVTAPRLATSRRGDHHFRPSMLVLEDRTVPSADMFQNATTLTG